MQPKAIQPKLKSAAVSALVLLLSTLIGLGALEAMLRVKNASMTNYDIEMWRYAKELKVRSDDPALGHTHRRNKSAVLQSVTIRTNEWGLRGPPLGPRDPARRRILFLGSSITLGWGVAEPDTVAARVERQLRALGENVEVLNAGVGNYNAERYVERFFTELQDLHPTDIVVQYFLRDAEKLGPGRDNFILRNSELAATTWIAASRLADTAENLSLVDHYRRVYDETQPGFQQMLRSLHRLADYAKANDIRLYMTMIPDVHYLKDYPFGYIHQHMKRVAADLAMTYVDLLPAFGKLSPEQIWAMPGDPHPNALGHKLMSEAIVPVLALAQQAHAAPRRQANR